MLTGCRRNEIAELKWDEVDLNNGLLVLDDSKTGKSIRPLCLAAATLLKGVEKVDDTDYVFPADEGDSYFQGTKNVWPKIVKKAELAGVTPHTLRHTTAMHLLQAGVDLTVIALWLGHESPVTTHGYVEADLAMKERALAAIAPPETRGTRYRPTDALLKFLQAL